MDQPWNCPHGRPTLQHLVALNNKTTTAAFATTSWRLIYIFYIFFCLLFSSECTASEAQVHEYTYTTAQTPTMVHLLFMSIVYQLYNKVIDVLMFLVYHSSVIYIGLVGMLFTVLSLSTSSVETGFWNWSFRDRVLKLVIPILLRVLRLCILYSAYITLV